MDGTSKQKRDYGHHFRSHNDSKRLEVKFIYTVKLNLDMGTETFYDVRTRKKVKVDAKDIKVKKVNGRFQLIGKAKSGLVYKFASEETAKKYK
jgi:hypothetical protein